MCRYLNNGRAFWDWGFGGILSCGTARITWYEIQIDSDLSVLMMKGILSCIDICIHIYHVSLYYIWMCKNPACGKVDILLRFSTRKSGLILGCAIGFLVWSLVINFPLLHHGFKFVFFQVMHKGNVIWMIWLPFCWLKGYRKIDFQSWKEISLGDGIFGSEHSVNEFGFSSAASFCKQLSNISHDLPRFFQPSKIAWAITSPPSILTTTRGYQKNV